jgi:hypothetical protein
MGFWYWGPPPASATSVLGIGFEAGYLDSFFARVRLITRLNNHLEVNNEEQHAPIWFATGLRGKLDHALAAPERSRLRRAG